MSSIVQVRVNPRLKYEVEELCQRMGMSLSVAIRLYLNQIWLEKKIPFEIHIPRKFFTIKCADTNGYEYRPELHLEAADILRGSHEDG